MDIIVNTKSAKKRYTLWNFIVDVVLVGLTGGLWLIWIFCRELRK